MFFAALALLTLSILSAAAAAPTAAAAATGTSFSIPRIRRNDTCRPDGKLALQRVYGKYGWTFNDLVPADVPNVITKVFAASLPSGSSSVSASPQAYHAEYLSPVTIGGQELQMDFDSGSSDFWVFSTYLSSSDIGHHTAYNPNKSSNFQLMNGLHWNIGYGDGSGAAGVVGSDTVTVGSATVTKQAIEMATAISAEFVSDPNNDGLVGLGFDSLNNISPTKQPTWFSNIKSSLKQPLWTADLREDGSGSYHFGEIPAGAYTGELKSVVVNKTRGWWGINSHTFSVNGVEQNRPNASWAIVDTGTSLLIVDEEVAQAWYAQIPGSGYSSNAGGYVYPCKLNSTLPSFSVAIGNLPAYDKYGRGRLVNIPTQFLAYAELDEQYCFGAIQGNGHSGLQIYGDVLFRSAFFVFYDQAPGEDGPTLGVADKGAATFASSLQGAGSVAALPVGSSSITKRGVDGVDWRLS